MVTQIQTSKGKPFPIGATVEKEGVNFSLYSKNATAVELLLFDRNDHAQPAEVIPLDPDSNLTSHYWHVHLSGIKSGQLYGYRVHGPFTPEEGLRFDPSKVLLDPYAKAVVTDNYSRDAARLPGDNCAQALKGVVVDTDLYDWEDDYPLNHDFARSIIYELHVGGFTKNPNSGLPPDLRGTYRGLIEKIPYLKSLGITTVELMPVQQFDPFDVPNRSLINYWGYSPVALFAPHNGYSQSNDPVGVLDEFRDMVKALHKAGIAVILDVVFNHTAEGNQDGPTLSLKGIENLAYYLLEDDRRYYQNYSGTGNTLRANHSVVRRMIRDCLRHWVSEFHIDGFRFDLASVLSRDEDGNPTNKPPILWSIDSDPVLASSKIIAEAWDIDLYQVGTFIGERWAEWNGKFRDDVRKFLKGDNGMAKIMANRITASSDVFKGLVRDPNRSINFVTCHDGFTLNDLVSYNVKHNLANGENNNDGTNANFSWNCGAEGPSNDPDVETLRLKQIKNFLTILMISQGTPMLSMGDEVRRTQLGNNNAYCQDNELSWFDWDLVVKNKDLLRFVQQLNAFNLSNPFFQEEVFWLAPRPLSFTGVQFHGIKLNAPDWSDHSHTIAFTLKNPKFGLMSHVMVNAYHESLIFEIPQDNGSHWKRIIETAQFSPNDILPLEAAPEIHETSYEVKEYSMVLLLAEM